jgi:2-aminoadipate transaminase
MRLNFSSSADEDIREGVRRIGKIVAEQLALYDTLTGRRPHPPAPPAALVEGEVEPLQPPADGAEGMANILQLPRRGALGGRRSREV